MRLKFKTLCAVAVTVCVFCALSTAQMTKYQEDQRLNMEAMLAVCPVMRPMPEAIIDVIVWVAMEMKAMGKARMRNGLTPNHAISH